MAYYNHHFPDYNNCNHNQLCLPYEDEDDELYDDDDILGQEMFQDFLNIKDKDAWPYYGHPAFQAVYTNEMFYVNSKFAYNNVQDEVDNWLRGSDQYYNHSLLILSIGSASGGATLGLLEAILQNNLPNLEFITVHMVDEEYWDLDKFEAECYHLPVQVNIKPLKRNINHFEAHRSYDMIFSSYACCEFFEMSTIQYLQDITNQSGLIYILDNHRANSRHNFINANYNYWIGGKRNEMAHFWWYA